MEKLPCAAVMALNKPFFPKREDLLGVLKADWGHTLPFSDSASNEKSITLRIDSCVCVLLFIEAPIPAETLRPLLTDKNPEETRALENNRSHIIISVLSDQLKPVHKYVILSKILYSMSSICDTPGVYWPSAPHLHTLQHFRNLAVHLKQNILPIPLWVRIDIIERENRNRAFTSGLAAFGIHEIEIHDSEKSGGYLYTTVQNLIHYLLEKGAVLSDGDAVVINDKETALIHFGESLLPGKKEVMILDFR